MADKIDDLTAAVAEFTTAQVEQLTAIDTEVQQLADLVASGGVTPERQAALQANIDNITAATAAMRASTAKLTGDDPAPAIP